jgi:phage major head subunit gpT-like protein
MNIKLSTRNSKEENLEVLKECLYKTQEFETLRESISARFGFDILDAEKFPVHKRNFSWKAVEKKLAMREADSSSSFAQVLRAGIQLIVNQMYETVPTTFEDWTHVIQSNKSEELYAPLHGIGFPSEVAKQEAYEEVSAAGLDIKLKNRKYGEMFAVEKELLEDDQTGQFKQQVGLMAKYLKQVIEVLAYGKLASVNNMKYGNLKVRKSETKPDDEANYPYSASGFIGGGKNRFVTHQALSQPAIQDAIIALMNMTNKLGLKMGVDPRRIIVSPRYRFDIAVLLNSSYYPSGAAPSGQVGGAFAINPLQSALVPTISRFVFDHTGKVDGNSKAWYIVDDSAPFFVVQIREAAHVEQEATNAGQSFERDIIRFKAYTRCNADFIDPRFCFQGNDGSV